MQGIPSRTKALVILMCNEMPDEGMDQNIVQPVHRQAMCFNAISSLTSGLGIHNAFSTLLKVSSE